jgi:hypothetical protein
MKGSIYYNLSLEKVRRFKQAINRNSNCLDIEVSQNK